MFIKVKYSPDVCHPRAFKAEGVVLKGEFSKKEANQLVETMRELNPRKIIDWNYAAGRVILHIVKKRWYER
jgi:hypothetical protein